MQIEPKGHIARYTVFYSASAAFAASQPFLQKNIPSFLVSMDDLQVERPDPADKDEKRRLKIGYLSPDLKRHPCAYFLEPFLRYELDRCRYTKAN